MDCSSDMRRDSGRRAAEKRALWRKLARVSNSEVELLNASKKDANIARYWALKFATIRPPALLSHSVPRRQETKRRADTRVRRARRCTSGSSCIYTMGSENFHRSAEKISRKNVQRGNSDVAPLPRRRRRGGFPTSGNDGNTRSTVLHNGACGILTEDGKRWNQRCQGARIRAVLQQYDVLAVVGGDVRWPWSMGLKDLICSVGPKHPAHVRFF